MLYSTSYIAVVIVIEIINDAHLADINLFSLAVKSIKIN
jgi:hypothetical protein